MGHSTDEFFLMFLLNNQKLRKFKNSEMNYQRNKYITINNCKEKNNY